MFYYVDSATQPIVDEFVPHIPENRMEDEDAEIERICLGKTLEGCFSASSELECFSTRHKKCPNYILRLYVFDENDIKPEHITDSYVLWHDALVPDANLTGEIWIEHQTLKPKEIKYFSVVQYQEEGVIQLSFEEWEKYEERFNLSKIFPNINNIPFNEFLKVTGEDGIERKTVCINLEAKFHNENELLFPKKIGDKTERVYFLDLSKYFPNVDDFRRFNDSDIKREIDKFIYRGFYDFKEKGIEFYYEQPVLLKDGFLKIFSS